VDKKVLMTGAAAVAVALVPGVAVAGPAVAAIVAETGTEEVKLEKVSGTVFDQQLSRPRKGCKG